MTHTISSKRLSLKDLHKIVHEVDRIELSDAAIQSINRSRNFLDEHYGSKDSVPTYGINTGFGSLCNTYIDHTDLQELQHNLIKSHACGTGDIVEPEIVRLMLFFKIQSLSYGHSGISLQVVERLIQFFNNQVYPVVYELGSLGASGDLAPLAHLSLPLIGLGEVHYKGKRMAAMDLNNLLGWDPIKLQSKEGLALINGTQFMLAFGTYNLIKSYQLWYWAHITTAMGIDGFECNASPYDVKIHMIRPHKGQIKSAALINDLLCDSSIFKNFKPNVQDPYSYRCVPQVHGASHDALKFVTNTIVTEANSVTDNPNIFVDSAEIISGGNFHGQQLALAMDYLSIALAEMGSISERRTFQLMSGQRGLPPFLVKKAGLHSGMMILQYTAASIVSQNKQLANPAVTDSIVSSNGQEDHVSMGANAATKLHRVSKNLQRILAIELIASCEALSYRTSTSSTFIETIKGLFREEIPILEEDRVLSLDIEKSYAFIDHLVLDEEVLYD
ncbi:MAG: histidine ammonia-lyase [Nonlabens sp.]